MLIRYPYWPLETRVQKRQSLYPPVIYAYSKFCSSESHTLNALGKTRLTNSEADVLFLP